MVEYSNDIKSQVMNYESEDLVVCHPYMLPHHIHVYVVVKDFKIFSNSKPKDVWLNAGTWYLREWDNKYHLDMQSNTADSIEDIVKQTRERTSNDH